MNNLNHQTKSHMSSPSLSSCAIGRTARIPPPSGRLFLPCLLDKTAEWGHNKINLMLSVTYAKGITGPNLNKKRRKTALTAFSGTKHPPTSADLNDPSPSCSVGTIIISERTRQIAEYDRSASVKLKRAHISNATPIFQQ